MAETADARTGRAQGQRLHGVRVLMLDDEPDTLDALCTALTMAGATVECISEPDAALGHVESFGPHVLVCDLYMPGTDGWTFMQRLRGRGSKVPAVALTAHPSAANRERALACGYVKCLAKPVHPEELIGVLRSVADAGRMRPEPRMSDAVGAEDRRLLEVIARNHGHGPRRPLALLDIAWAELGSADAGRAALQRLVFLGLVTLRSRDCVGTLTNAGAQLAAEG